VKFVRRLCEISNTISQSNMKYHKMDLWSKIFRHDLLLVIKSVNEWELK